TRRLRSVRLMTLASTRSFRDKYSRQQNIPFVGGGTRMRRRFVFVLLLAALSGCNRDAETAREALVQMNVIYSDASFLEQASQGNSEVVKLFLNAGINPEAKTNEGQTALMAAALSGHLETVGALLDKGADVNATNKFGGTA